MSTYEQGYREGFKKGYDEGFDDGDMRGYQEARERAYVALGLVMDNAASFSKETKQAWRDHFETQLGRRLP